MVRREGGRLAESLTSTTQFALVTARARQSADRKLIGVVVEGAPGVYAGWYQPYNPLVVTESVQVATIYTTLFDVRTSRPVWTYNAPTYDPASLRQDAPSYANDVAGRLQGTGLFAGP